MNTLDTRTRPNIRRHLPALRAALEQQREFRLEQLRELDEALGDAVPAYEGDAQDEVNQLLRTAAVAALNEVDDALDRLRAGTYAICESCSTPIPHERLEILPMSRYCMSCQRVLESRRG
jgi:RNA polymerase-binding transcription factor DksA